MSEHLVEWLEQLQVQWQSLGGPSAAGASQIDLTAFQVRTGFVLPADIRQYFAKLNGTCGRYDNNFFRFNGLAEFKSVDEELRYWGGSPDYTGIIYTLPTYQDCFVLADWSIQCVTYVIRLHKKPGGSNEVYHICGDAYQAVASSFTDFILSYLTDDLLI